ncbi:hypothetical protein Q8F55_005920 [Vanrija albida]|uniref:Putative tyrosine-protein phosphatase OCA1 n=1 Tax=Vanrija albida TaxID=181172 RepID=A0ABR3Q3Q7_9TREE
MLTPPYHFSIVSAPLGPSSTSNHILYRGSFPAARNASFLRRLGIKTLVCLRKKPLKDDEPLAVWAVKRGIDVQWVKAEKMTEEKLGMERQEVGDVLKILLNPAAYPIYIADADGTSHTTLVVAALRKLQGWHRDCIMSEIFRFEPDHDDLPLESFMTSYLSLSGGKDDPQASLSLPPAPYPSWLWPSVPVIPEKSRHTIPFRNNERSTSSAPSMRSDRDRAASGASTASTGSAAPSLPFPNPLTVRRHPSMRLTFPAAPPLAAATVSTSQPRSEKSGLSRQTPTSEASDSLGLTQTSTSAADAPPAPVAPGMGARRVSFHDPNARFDPETDLNDSPTGETGPSAARWNGRTPSGGSGGIEGDVSAFDDDDEDDEDEGQDSHRDEEDDADLEDDEYSEDEESDEEEEEEEDEDEPPTSQFISALDLAGFG